jgi:hypothetical protein
MRKPWPPIAAFLSLFGQMASETQDRLFFDRTPLSKDLGSFHHRNLFLPKSFLSSLFSGFLLGQPESFQSAFDICVNSDASHCAFIVRPFVYLVSLSNNSVNFVEIPNLSSSRGLAMAFPPTAQGPIVLAQSHVYSFDMSLRVIEEKKLCQDCSRLFSFCGQLVGLSSSSIVSIANNAVLSRVPTAWKSAISSSSIIGLINKSTLTLIGPEFQILPGPPSFAHPIIDCTFSRGGTFLYVLESSSSVSIFSTDDGFSRVAQFESVGATSLCFLNDSHVMALDDFGTLEAFDVAARRSVHKDQVTARSVLRGGDIGGFFVFEPIEQTGDFWHFSLTFWNVVPPDELYRRYCKRGYFGDALALMRRFPGLDSDIYHKYFIKQNPRTVELLDEHFPKIKNKNWVVSYCRRTVDPSFDVNHKLLDIALEIDPKDGELNIFKHRLSLLERINTDGLGQIAYEKFRTCDLESELSSWAERSLFDRVTFVVQTSIELAPSAKERIAEAVPPMTEPSLYQRLLLCLDRENWFRERALMIDAATGLTSVIIQVLTIGSWRFPALVRDVELAREYEHFIFDIANEQVACSFSFQRYSRQMDDDERLMLFAAGQSPAELVKELDGPCQSIVARSEKSLFAVLESVLCSQRPPVFSTLGLAAKLEAVQGILAKVQHSTDFANEIIFKVRHDFTSESFTLLLNSFRPHLDKTHKRLLQFAMFAIEAGSGVRSGAELRGIPDNPALLLTVAEKLCDPSFAAVWPRFSTFFRKFLRAIGRPELLEHLKKSELRSLMLQNRQEDYEISTPGLRDFTIQLIYELLDQCTSCDSERDTRIGTAGAYLGMIAGDLQNEATKAMWDLFNTFDKVSRIDPWLPPRIICRFSDTLDLVCTIVDRMEKPAPVADAYGKVIRLAKDLEVAHFAKINSKFAEMCLRENVPGQALSWLADADDNIKLEFLESASVPLAERQRLCDSALLQCDPWLLPRFLDWKLRTDFVEVSLVNVLLDSLLTVDSEQLFGIGVKLIDADDLPSVLRLYCSKKLQDLDMSFVKLIRRLYDMKFASADDFSELGRFLGQELLQLRSLGHQMIALRQLEEGRLPVEIAVKLQVVTLSLLEKWLLPPPAVFSIPAVLSVLKANNTKRNDAGLFAMLTAWRDMGQLTPEIAGEAVVLFKAASHPEKRQFWSETMNEAVELQVVERTRDAAFGFSSKWPSVVQKTHEQIQACSDLSEKVVREIIEAKQAFVYAGEPLFKAITKEAKGKEYARLIFESLAEHQMADVLVQFAVDLFSIPEQFVDPLNRDAIIASAKRILCEG